jgi:hypothetical protein
MVSGEWCLVPIVARTWATVLDLENLASLQMLRRISKAGNINHLFLAKL